jgi:hypothetical protein
VRGERQWATFGGKIPGRVRQCDIDLKSNYAYCLQLAWDMFGGTGVSREDIIGYGMDLETYFLQGKFDLGGPGGPSPRRLQYDPFMSPEEWREMFGVARGDAWEPLTGGDVSFNVEEFEV